MQAGANMVEFQNIGELLSYYNDFKGKTLLELNNYVQTTFPALKGKISTNKGVVGQILEGLVGNPPNSDPRPDIQSLNVELKVLPLRKTSKQLQPKERSKIKSLNYTKILEEEWETTELRTKMENILFLMYEQPVGKTYKDWSDFIFQGVILYELESEDEDCVRNDWYTIKKKVENFDAHNLSEGDCQILGACTSGTGKLQEYGAQIPAKQRSFSLKHSFVKQFYFEKMKKAKYVTIKVEPKLPPIEFLVKEIENNLSGKTVHQLVNQYGEDLITMQAKSQMARLINRCLGLQDNVKVKQFEKLGIQIKTVPVNHEGKPWEAMSFPKFSLVDLTEEEWSGEIESHFKQLIDNPFVFLPIIKNKVRENAKLVFEPVECWSIGKPIIWKPSLAEMEQIEKEWNFVKNIVMNEVKTEIKQIKNGTMQKNNLPKMTESEIIHVRPHARDSKDIDLPYQGCTEGRVSMCWQSFWLNKKFIERILC